MNSRAKLSGEKVQTHPQPNLGAAARIKVQVAISRQFRCKARNHVD
jgi:hypothetical protein